MRRRWGSCWRGAGGVYCRWDYYVEADEYSGGFLFKTQRTGAFFYVLAEKAAEARVFLESKGYKPQPALPVEG